MATARTPAVSTESRGVDRRFSAIPAQESAARRAVPATTADEPRVGHPPNQATRARAKRTRSASSGACRPRAGEMELNSADGLELLQESVRGGGALQDRGGTRDLVDCFFDDLGPP